MALQYILDGYNIIKGNEKMADCSLEQGRAMLLQVIAHNRPQGSLRNQITVVFDGKRDVWGSSPSSVAKVFFTSGETADDYIKRMIDRSTDLKNTIVVTNDGELTCYIKKSGAKVLSVADFMSIKKKSEQHSGNKKGASSGLSDGKRITRAVEGEINKEMEDFWINK